MTPAPAKHCTYCLLALPMDEFRVRHTGGYTWHESRCRPCERAYNRLRYRTAHNLPANGTVPHGPVRRRRASPARPIVKVCRFGHEYRHGLGCADCAALKLLACLDCGAPVGRADRTRCIGCTQQRRRHRQAQGEDDNRKLQQSRIKGPGLRLPSGDVLSLDFRCGRVGCGVPLIYGTRCYECATGRPRELVIDSTAWRVVLPIAVLVGA